MKILDSSFLFAYFIEEDSLHELSLEKANSLKMNECVVLYDVFRELISIVSVRHNSKFAIEIGEEVFTNFQIYSPKKEERKAIWKEFQKLSPHRFSYTDVSLYYFAKFRGLELISFDKVLLQRL
jgi:predicted nucleic acid-binding protein